jgi:coenzyme F420-0:L-glutamate ligase / coenzyme F420-1:gamma-L-glutamate ligase
MPDLFEVIHARRSIRKFQPQPVPKELVLEVLAASGRAPSAHNAQPYGFIILENAKIKQELADAMAQVWVADLAKDGQTIDADKRQERVERFAKAPALILACITRIEGLPNYSDDRRQTCLHDLAVQSLGAAIENLLLAAHAKNLGACWYSAPCFCKETVRQTLEIPDAVEPQAFVVLGYPAENPSSPLKKPLAAFCFVDEWGRTF